MTITKEMMINEVIHRLGFENKYTIWFCGFAEDTTVTDSTLLNTMVCVIEMGEMEEDA